MSKYIAVDALQDINKYFFSEIGEIIENAPTIDVVRCKDCKYLFSGNGCPLRTFRTHVENDYCSYGEEKEKN